MTAQTVGPVDFDVHYTISGWSEGIAWYLLGYVMVRDEDFDWTGIAEEDRSRVRAVMVGDDRIFTADVDDLTVIGEEDFCRGCGQVGCGCEVWS
jgi:hypothetical protein